MSLWWRSMRALIVKQGALYALSLAGVALGVAAVVSIQIINQNALATFSASVEAIALKANLLVRAESLDESVLASVLSDEDVVSAQALHRAEVVFFKEDGEKVYLDVLGLDLSLPGALPLEGDGGSLGAILSTPGWVAMPPELAVELGLKPGERFDVVAGTRAVALEMGATVNFRRIAPLASSRLLVMDIAQSQDRFGEAGVIDEINVFLSADVVAERLSQVQSRLQAALGDDVRVETPGERRRQAEGLLQAFRLNLTALSLVSFLVGLFLVYTTTEASLVRRRRELGVLRALGATERQAGRMLILEASLVGVVGTLVGLPAGWLAARLNIDSVSATLRDIYLLEEIERVVVPAWIIILALILGLGGALLGALVPTVDALRREPRELLGRRRPAPVGSGFAPRLALAGAVVLATSLLWYVVVGNDVDIAGFILAAALLLAIPLLIPWVIERVSSKASAERVGMRYAVRTLNSGGSSSTSLTIAALAIVFSMLVAITLMIGSFRATLEVWIDRVVIADVFISTATSDRGMRRGGLDEEVLTSLQKFPGVAALDTIRRRDIDLDGRRVRLVAVDLGLPDAVERFPLVAGDPASLADTLLSDDAVLVTEPFWRKSKRGVGDTVHLPTSQGSHALRIAGVFYDYSSENGVIYMHRELYRRLFGTEPPLGAALYLDEDVDPEVVVGELREQLSIPGLNIRSNRTLRARVLEVFEQTFAITRLLQGMSLVIASFGIALALFVTARERLMELALYSACGATRSQVFRFFVGKGAAMGGVATTIGMLAGVILAGILIFVVNRKLFGWTIQVSVPWWSLLQQVLVMAIVIVLASVLPALRASRAPATELTSDGL